MFVCVCVFFCRIVSMCVCVTVSVVYLTFIFLLQYFLSFFLVFSISFEKRKFHSDSSVLFFFTFNVLPSKANAAIGRGKQIMDTKVCVCVCVCLFVCVCR